MFAGMSSRGPKSSPAAALRLPRRNKSPEPSQAPANGPRQRARSSSKTRRRSKPQSIDGIGTVDGASGSHSQVATPTAASKTTAGPCGRRHDATFNDMLLDPEYDYLADNEAILTGYRTAMSCAHAFRSLFALHNETINVWSHGIGACTFLTLLLYVLGGGLVPAGAPLSNATATFGDGTLTPQVALLQGQQQPLGWGLGAAGMHTTPIFLDCAQGNTWQVSCLNPDGGLLPRLRSSPLCPLSPTGACTSSGPGGAALAVHGYHTPTLFWSVVLPPHCPACWVRLPPDSHTQHGTGSSGTGTGAARLCWQAHHVFSPVPGAQVEHLSGWLATAFDELMAHAPLLNATIPGTSAASHALEVLQDALAATVAGLAHVAPTSHSLQRVSAGLHARIHSLSQFDALDASAYTQWVETTGESVREAVADALVEFTGVNRHGAVLEIDDGRELTAAEQAEDAWYAAQAHTHHTQPADEYTPHSEHVPQWPMVVFLLSAFTLLLASAMYHLLNVVDRSWYELLARVDYSAIAILICGSSVPAFYYGFFCMPFFMYLYIGCSIVTCSACLIMSLAKKFRSRDWRLVRMSAFLVTGLFGVVPFGHMFISSQEQNVEALYGLLLMGILYVSGALLYGFRIPERTWPGMFDLFFASHQIFHINVFAACIVHYFTMVSHYQWRVQHAVCGE